MVVAAKTVEEHPKLPGTIHSAAAEVEAAGGRALALQLDVRGWHDSPIQGGDGNREFLDGKSFIETFALIGALSAVTTRLQFNVFVLKLPIRPPPSPSSLKGRTTLST